MGGVGPTRRISGAGSLAYQITFENSPTSAVPVQQLTASTQLDPFKADLTTFNFGPVVLGSQVITPSWDPLAPQPPGTANAIDGGPAS